jgi:hypothetical protein
MQMENCLDKTRKVLFGGEISLSCWISLKGWLLLLQGMDQPAFYGMTAGVANLLSLLTLSYFLLQKKTSHLP